MYSQTDAGRSPSFDDAPYERPRVAAAVKMLGRCRMKVREFDWGGDYETFCRAIPLLEAMYMEGAHNGFARAVASCATVCSTMHPDDDVKRALSQTNGLVDVFGHVERDAVAGYVAACYVKGAAYYDMHLKWSDVPEICDIARCAVNSFDGLDHMRYLSNYKPIK